MSQSTDTEIKGNPGIKQSSGQAVFLKRLFKEKPLGFIGGVIVVLLLLTGIFANLLAPYPYDQNHLADRLKPPGTKYIFGTDSTGRDVFSRVIYGARISMIIGLAATLLSTVISNMIGLFSGFIGGTFDLVVQRFIDTWLCLPWLVLLLLLISLTGAGIVQLILVLGISGGIGGSRGPRMLVMWFKQNAYVGAARAIGQNTWGIVIHHLLRNIMPFLIVGFSMGVGGTILAEASLSFLGFGVPPPFPSWGQMISGYGAYYMERAPWMALFPGLALTIAIWAMNMFGDAARDLLDPRLRGGVGGMGAYGAKQSKKVLRKIIANAEKIARGQPS